MGRCVGVDGFIEKDMILRPPIMLDRGTAAPLDG